ncbi:MAG TPA: T9SS type A sorting domain-containing protein [Chitinophagaceae bacterium]|nr:T9SS type A sorting domain-containing protein [Chitinophagaceae bacterium]
MKSKLLILLPLLWTVTLSAQLTITPGAQFSVVSDAKLTLKNTDLINNGNFLLATTSPVSFTGDASSFISGDQAVRFFKLEINKTGNQSVSLHKTISIGSGVFFVSGFLDLNGFDLDLETTAHLDGEREGSRVIGSNGGSVVFPTNLNAPTSVNAGNLGIFITSDQNMGNVTIKRGHQSQVNGNGLSKSILRYYDILPANNTNLNATLRFNYFDGELNGINENSLLLFKSDNTIDWSIQGFTSRDAASNFVEKNGINSFSRWTLSNVDNPLPLLFTLFNTNCDGNKVMITWKTAQEQNSSHFDIERNTDGVHWTVIGNLPASGNSADERSYLFIDGNPVQNSNYRIAEHDLDGRIQYTSIIRSSCNITDRLSLWPNPLHDMIFVNIVTGNESQAIIKIFDSKGALVKMQKSTVLPGSNQLRIDTRSLANGVYSLHVDWNHGQIQKAIQVIKQ